MKVIVAGCRDITDYAIVKSAIESSGFEITEVVSGCQSGADTFGELWAHSHNIPVKPFPADWKKYGLPAGPIRNKQMAKYGEALIAVWDGRSPGTRNMILNAEKRGLKVYIHGIN